MTKRSLVILGLVGLLSAASAHADGFIAKSKNGDAAAARKSTALPASSATLETATPQQLASAVGHYARARSLLIAAVREFDKGYAIANPDALLDSALFRNTLITRAQELEHVLDPQPRASKGGVRFNTDSRLLGQTK